MLISPFWRAVSRYTEKQWSTAHVFIRHVLFNFCVNKEIVFLPAVAMNSAVACYVIPLLLTNYYSGNQIEKN